jgi:rhamnosyltransferase
MTKTIAVVITYNASPNYRDNLLSYINQVDKVIIVDNGSLEPTITMLNNLQQEFKDKIKIIYNQENQGIAEAQNAGIAIALTLKCKFILFFDHDSQAKNDMVEKLTFAYEDLTKQGYNVGIVGASSVDKNCPDHKNKFITSKDNIFFKKSLFSETSNYLDVLCVISSGSMIKSELFGKIGDFRSEFFIDYVDFEYCLRAIDAGYNVFAVKDAILYHQLGNMKIHRIWGFDIFTSNHSPKRRYTIFRNRIKVWKLYYDKVPAFVLFDFLSSFYFITKVMLLEENKIDNLTNIIKGIFAGIKS